MGSDRADAGGLGALLALADLELHALVLVQAAEAGALALRVVHEDVSATAVRGDEAEALLGVEPLHSSLCHYVLLKTKVQAAAVATTLFAFRERDRSRTQNNDRGTVNHTDACRRTGRVAADHALVDARTVSEIASDQSRSIALDLDDAGVSVELDRKSDV